LLHQKTSLKSMPVLQFKQSQKSLASNRILKTNQIKCTRSSKPEKVWSIVFMNLSF